MKNISLKKNNNKLITNILKLFINFISILYFRIFNNNVNYINIK